jgi:hypothetical protein
MLYNFDSSMVENSKWDEQDFPEEGEEEYFSLSLGEVNYATISHIFLLGWKDKFSAPMQNYVWHLQEIPRRVQDIFE